MFTLSTSDWFLFGATTVKDGNLLNEGTEAYAERCRTIIHRAYHDVSCATIARTVHGSRVEIVTRESPLILQQTDGLVTNEAGIALCVTGADCAPVFLVDHAKKVIALVHAGRRGTQTNIAAHAVTAMQERFGSQASDIGVVIGPSICAAHYEVSQEIAESFRKAHPSREKKSHLDLPGCIRDQLMVSGLCSDRVTIWPECTFEHPKKWFSHRRDVRDGIEEFRVQLFFAVKIRAR